MAAVAELGALAVDEDSRRTRHDKKNISFSFGHGYCTCLCENRERLANEAHAMLSRLSDQDRNSTLTKFLKQSNENCDTVVRNFFQGFDKDHNAFWNVACRNKKSYVIMIKNDKVGSTKIMDCGVLKMLKAGECFKKF